MAFLIGMTESVKGQKFELKKDRTTIGRNASNDIVLDDATLSSQHCYVSCRGDRFVLHDLNSTNGTRLNMERITEAELSPKQILQLGAVELMFEDENAPAGNMGDASRTEVHVDAAPPVATPKSFSSVSPFGTRRKDQHRRLWIVIIALVGILALAGVAWLIVRLFNLSKG